MRTNTLLSALVVSALVGLVGPGELRASGGARAGFAVDNGDTNGDLRRDFSDAISLLKHIFLGTAAPVPLADCAGEPTEVENGDVNGDGRVGVSDAIGLFHWLIFHRREPVAACGEDGLPRLVPTEADPYGQAYGDWAGVFWQWLLSFPGDETNPFLSEDCVTERQPEELFLLTGAVASDPVVTRHCTVGEGTSLFFPIVNTECSNLEPDPFGCVDEPSCLACNDVFYSAENDVVELTVDGIDIPDLTRFRVQSGIFEVNDLPANNFLGAPEGSSGISLADGYYILLAPLSEGEHTIEFRGCLDGFGGCAGFEVLVAYEITVE